MSPEALMESLPAPRFAAELAPPEPRPPEPGPQRPAVAIVAREPLTPFLPVAEDDGTFPEALTREPDAPLLVAVLREPARIAGLLLERRGTQQVVLTSVLTAVACSAFRAAWLGSSLRPGLAWPALELGLAVLLGAAAALGPIYATSILVSARMPAARLGAALLAALASGSLLLAGLAPPVWLAWRMDPQGLGAYSVLGAFLLVAIATGARIHRLLFELARQTLAAHGEAARLTPEAQFRVGIVARVAWMVLGLTTALAFLGVAAP